MVKIRWLITDDLSNLTIEEFDNEYNGIVSGYFEFTVNQNTEGFYPQKIVHKEEGLEDILYWLGHLIEGVNMIRKGERYEMCLLTMNIYKLVMRFDNCMHISFIKKESNEVKWIESISIQEFEKELYNNVDQFLQTIKEINPALMESRWIKKLSNFEDRYM